MDDTVGTTPTNQYQVTQPPPVTPQRPTRDKRRDIMLWGLAAFVVILGTTALFFAREVFVSKQTPVTPTPAPTATPTPTPIREPSSLATQSAFLSLSDSVSLLSASIQAYSVQDPSLSPPVLELPLGFQN